MTVRPIKFPFPDYSEQKQIIFLFLRSCWSLIRVYVLAYMSFPGSGVTLHSRAKSYFKSRTTWRAPKSMSELCMLMYDDMISCASNFRNVLITDLSILNQQKYWEWNKSGTSLLRTPLGTEKCSLIERWLSWLQIIGPRRLIWLIDLGLLSFGVFRIESMVYAITVWNSRSPCLQPLSPLYR
jgi:hypothetical protein